MSVSDGNTKHAAADAADLLDAMHGALGAHHARAVHAKGVLLEAKDIASKGPNYLSDEIMERVRRGPVLFDWFAQVAGTGDVVDDPSVAWPADRKLVLLGTIELVRLSFDQAASDRTLVFSPGNVPPGIEPADPLIAARDATYKLSYRARQ